MLRVGLPFVVASCAAVVAQTPSSPGEAWWQVRSEAVLRLRQVARAPVAIPGDPNFCCLPPGRTVTLTPSTMERIEVARLLLDGLAAAADDETRAATLVALGEIGIVDGGATRSIRRVAAGIRAALRDGLHDRCDDVRAAAALGLGLCGADAADRQALAARLDDAAGDVRVLAAHGLAATGRFAADPLVQREVVRVLCERAQRCESSRRWCELVEALGCCLPPGAAPGLQASVRRGVETAAATAARAGAKAEAAVAAVALRMLAASPASPDDPVAIVQLTAVLGPDARDAFTAFLVADRTPVRALREHLRERPGDAEDWPRVALCLAALGDRVVAPELTDLLRYRPAPEQRTQQILRVLGRIGERRCLGTLQHVFHHDPSRGVHLAAIRALGHVAAARDVPWHLPWSAHVDPLGPSPLLAALRRHRLLDGD